MSSIARLVGASGWSPLPDEVVDALCGDLVTLGVYVVILRRARRLRAPIVTPRGQVIEFGEALVGRTELAALLGVSDKRVRTAITRLAGLGLIRARSGASRGTVVTVLRYDEYLRGATTEGPGQGPGRGQLGARKGPAGGQKRNRETEKQRDSRAREETPTEDLLSWSEASQDVEEILGVLAGERREPKRTRPHLELVPPAGEEGAGGEA